MESSLKRANDDEVESTIAHSPQTLSRPISPPTKRAKLSNPESATAPASASPILTPSPWQLTWIRDLPDSDNQNAVTLKDLLGDPLIDECWEFNFLHDIHFLMDAFDADTKHLVKVHVVHGFWKREDPQRLRLVVSSPLHLLRCLAINLKRGG